MTHFTYAGILCATGAAVRGAGREDLLRGEGGTLGLQRGRGGGTSEAAGRQQEIFVKLIFKCCCEF